MRPAPSVVIADDDADLRMFLTTLLELDGLRVVGSACNGAEAIRLAAAERPDCAVLDYLMPGCEGEHPGSVLNRMLPDMPIVAFSSILPGRPSWARDHLDKAHVLRVPGAVRALVEDGTTVRYLAGPNAPSG